MNFTADIPDIPWIFLEKLQHLSAVRLLHFHGEVEREKSSSDAVGSLNANHVAVTWLKPGSLAELEFAGDLTHVNSKWTQFRDAHILTSVCVFYLGMTIVSGFDHDFHDFPCSVWLENGGTCMYPMTVILFLFREVSDLRSLTIRWILFRWGNPLLDFMVFGCLWYFISHYILLGGLEHGFDFSIQLGISSSQLMNIFQRGWNHQPG